MDLFTISKKKSWKIGRKWRRPRSCSNYQAIPNSDEEDDNLANEILEAKMAELLAPLKILSIPANPDRLFIGSLLVP